MPFILIFTIIFAVLQRTKILGKDEEGKPRKNFNVIISLVMALAVVIPHVTGRYPYGLSVVDIINEALPNVALVAVIIVMILLIIGVFGKELDIGGSSFGGIFVILAFLVILFIFGTSAGWFDNNLPSWLYFLQDPQLQALVVTLLVFGIVIWLITKEDKPKTGNDTNLLKEINKMIKNP
ncbi:hypothetical protein COV13_02140 [Candidatus Woesearchaeota archaeon CG10_big_fil_rev_8_21_14_0_10_32_9]|nr:MAG: hypothetical protein COV13_02140 [Candidatus Woesearchaeota archaeon CG10_big_fil_rev_8_21_14_0_10_32_9]